LIHSPTLRLEPLEQPASGFGIGILAKAKALPIQLAGLSGKTHL
jgi:hypothetical protein